MLDTPETKAFEERRNSTQLMYLALQAQDTNEPFISLNECEVSALCKGFSFNEEVVRSNLRPVGLDQAGYAGLSKVSQWVMSISYTEQDDRPPRHVEIINDSFCGKIVLILTKPLESEEYRLECFQIEEPLSDLRFS